MAAVAAAHRGQVDTAVVVAIQRTQMAAAENDEDLAGAWATADHRADDDVGESVTVEVAAAAQRAAGKIGSIDAADEITVSAVEGGKIQAAARSHAGPAEHEICFAGIRGAEIALLRADEKVLEAVAVDVAGGA